MQARHGEVDEGGAVSAADVRHCLMDEFGSFARDCAVAIENGQSGKAREIARDVLTRRLKPTRRGNAEAIVFDVEQHRQLQRCRHRQRGPKAVGRHGSIATEHHADRAVKAAIAQHVLGVFDRLRVTRGGRILRADAAAHRQRRGAFAIRVVENDADIASVRIAAGTAHRRAQCIFQRDAKRQQNWARAVVSAHRVFRMREVQPQQHLRHVVAAGAELVENFLAGDELALLDRVHGARGLNDLDDAFPVRLGGGFDGWLRFGAHATRKYTSSHAISVQSKRKSWIKCTKDALMGRSVHGM